MKNVEIDANKGPVVITIDGYELACRIYEAINEVARPMPDKTAKENVATLPDDIQEALSRAAGAVMEYVMGEMCDKGVAEKTERGNNTVN